MVLLCCLGESRVDNGGGSYVQQRDEADGGWHCLRFCVSDNGLWTMAKSMDV